MSCGCPRVLLSNPESYAELLAALTQGVSLTTPVSASSVQDLKQMSKHPDGGRPRKVMSEM